MNLENNITNLELSKRLKELNFPQKSLFYYVNVKQIGNEILENEVWFIAYISQLTGLSKDWYSAYTATELLELLPGDINIKYINDDGIGDKLTYRLSIQKCSDNEFSIYYDSKYMELISIDEKYLANGLAKMLIHLLENNLIKIEDLK